MRQLQPQERRDLINAGDACVFLKRAYRIVVLPATIRQWATRKHIGSYGDRRERYDLREIVRYAQKRGLVPRSAELPGNPH